MRTSPRMSRRVWLVLAPAAGLAVPLRGGETLDVRLAGGQLKISAPRLSFISGKALDRLHDGAPVPFALQASLYLDRLAPPVTRDIERFVISYDLWEGKFAVTLLGPRRRTSTQPTTVAAETWCVGELALPTTGLNETQPFWVRLEVRAEDPARNTAPSDEPMSLARLIDLFSRRGRGEERRVEAEAGPFRLADLKRAEHGSLRLPAPGIAP